MKDAEFTIEDLASRRYTEIGRLTDDVATGPILEIKFQDVWVVTDPDIWRSWTGFRRLNGEDFHGKVHPMAHPDKIWTGPRVCPCRVCQDNSESKYRPN